MTEPSWLAVVLAAVMLLIAAASGLRLVLWRLCGVAAEPEGDAIHVLMGVAMAGMFVPQLDMAPEAAWRALFLVAAAWFAWRAVRTRGREHDASGRRPPPGRWRCAHPAPHSVECAAMVYMLLPAPAVGHGPGMAMPGTTGAALSANPAVALVLALFMLGYIVWIADRITGGSVVHAAPARPGPRNDSASDGHGAAGAARGGWASAALSGRAAACARIGMGLAMGYMLLTMV